MTTIFLSSAPTVSSVQHCADSIPTLNTQTSTSSTSIGIDYQQAIKGLVVLGAVAFDLLNKKRAGAAG